MSSSGSTGTRVLIVEDEKAAREASKRYLARQGFSVSSAASASEALQKAAESTPNVVICDWNLGDEPDGTDVARELQSRYSVPIIFVTAYPLARLREATRDLEVIRYMRKPVRLAALAQAINRSAN